MVVLKRTAVAALVFSSAAALAQQPPVIEIDTGAKRAGDGVVVNRPNGVSLRGNDSQTVLLVQQLQDEIRFLRGQVEELNFKLKRMEADQKDRYRDLDRRVSALMTGAAAAGNTATAGNGPGSQIDGGNVGSASAQSAVSAAAAANGQAVSGTPQPAPGVSDLQAYREAFAKVRSRDFDEAVESFSAFVRDYPKSPRMANAHYWLGEVYLAQQVLEKARESFALVLNQYPDHSKAAHAAYKLGVIYRELKDTAQSNKYFDYVLTNHPDSDVAGLVKEQRR